MTDEDTFMAAVLAEPRDDTLRLVFADWLEERGGRGDAARAEFIRLSIRAPEVAFWGPSRAAEEVAAHPDTKHAQVLCLAHWAAWTDLLCTRLVSSPLHRWLTTNDCRWGYRRGFVAVFEGTQQVLLDGWDDLFQLGPIEEVQVNNLCHLGMAWSLRQFLDRSSLRVLRLRAAELRDDDVKQLSRLSDWLIRFERVELFAIKPDQVAAQRLQRWLNSEESLRHVRWQK